MSREKIEDIIKKVVLGESFAAGPDEDEVVEDDTSDDLEDDTSDEENIEEAKCSDDDEDEDEDEDEEEESSNKLSNFLKKKKAMREAAELAEEDVHDVNGKGTFDVNKKGAKFARPTGDSSAKNKATITPKASAAKATTEEVEVDESLAATAGALTAGSRMSGAKKPLVKKKPAPKLASEVDAEHQKYVASLKKEGTELVGVESLFEGQELSEEFKAQTALLFEAHVAERVHQIEEELQTGYETLLEEHTTAVTEELVERIDEYLNYVVEEWMQENRLAVENGLRTEVTEKFISNLKDLFTESYIEVPEDKVDLFDSAVEQCDSLETELGSQVEKNMELAEENDQLRCEILFREVTEGMIDTDSEKLRRLSESIEFETVEQFAEKLSVLKENIGSIGSTENVSEETEEGIEESFEESSETSASPLMEAYMRSMTKSSL
jgi:hypothetical protein